jgi:hypothetical protein
LRRCRTLLQQRQMRGRRLKAKGRGRSGGTASACVQVTLQPFPSIVPHLRLQYACFCFLFSPAVSCASGINSCSRLLRSGGAAALILAKGIRPSADTSMVHVTHACPFRRAAVYPDQPPVRSRPLALHAPPPPPLPPPSAARMTVSQIRPLRSAQNSRRHRRPHVQVHPLAQPSTPSRANPFTRELGSLLHLNACACVCVRSGRPPTAAQPQPARRCADDLARCVVAHGCIPSLPAAAYLPLKVTMTK